MALAAAFLHVVWNLIVKVSPDRLVAAFTVSAGGALLNVPVLAVVGLPDRRVWGLVMVSAVVQTLYMILLSKAYEKGDMSFVYPVARGFAPLIVTGAGVLLLGDRVGVGGALGVLVVMMALTALATGRSDRTGLGWALATGLSIATYTTIDAAASRLDGSAIPVVGAMFIVHTALMGAYVAIVRGPGSLLELFIGAPVRSLAAAVGSASGYLLVMSAAVMAPVGLVAAIRETSVVLGVLAGRRFLAERVSRLHWVAVGFAALGTILIGIS
jgi:drug/metabolite transporter (DMT)-like permease